MGIFLKRTLVESSAADLFRWHANPGAFERLIAPWERVTILERPKSITNGNRAAFKVKAGPISLKWVAEYRDYVEGSQFRDVMVSGPVSKWQHTHSFVPNGKICYYEDRIEFKPPFGFLGKYLGEPYLRRRLQKLFRYRHRLVANDIGLHQKYSKRRVRILVAGSTGLIGSSLVPFLSTGGHDVMRLVRPHSNEAGPVWDPAAGKIDANTLEGFDAIIHLSGRNIGVLRLTSKIKEEAYNSRILSTRLLCNTICQLANAPKVLVSASAVGYYGDRGSDELDEESGPGEGFLPRLGVDWERETGRVSEAGVRVVNLRTGIVLTPAGGYLSKLLPIFNAGLGGKLGAGDQYLSWIGMDDLLGIILHAIGTPAVSGPVNAVSPNPVTNEGLTKSLGRILSRPTLMRVPKFAIRLAMGEAADELLLASQRVIPKKLTQTGYSFLFPHVEPALRYMLGYEV